MELRRNRVTTSVRTEGGLLPADLLAKIAAGERDVPGLGDADYGLAAGERPREAITRSWNRLVGAWAALEAVRVGAEADVALTGATRERFLLPLFDELGFGRLAVARPVEVEGTSYPISHAWGERVPIHLVGFEVPLDARTKGVRGAAGAAPHALVQEFLNRSDDALWGLVSNGRILRLLRDSTSLTRQAFVEFDLEAIFEGELFADFALLWSVLHRTRFDGERPSSCLLEEWTKKAAEDGTRALDKLRGGVEKAIETLGAGFLAHPANGTLREALRSGGLDRQDYYRELLRLVYRLVFLFTAEDRRDEETGRELLLDPEAPDEAADRYRRYYSTARLRSLAARRRGTRHPDLWVGLRRIVGAIGTGGAPSIALPALGSFLFSADACRDVDSADLRNEDLLGAVRALATIEEDRRLRAVDYRNLGAEELGAIYEGLLELHPRIELDANPPRFMLDTAAGNERKATGSYYTPTSLITVLLDSALDPVVDEAVRGKTGSEAERAILELAVADPAAGSGHFVIAAAHRLAKRLAAVRTGDDEPAPGAVRHALRDVISHSIYAVDVNPMAVELCKVSLWLEALEPGRPLSFLDAHVKSGNSLLGTTPELAESGIPDGAFEPIAGDARPVAAAWRKRNAQEKSGQQALFEAPLGLPTGVLAAASRDIDALSEDSPAAVAAKGARHAEYEASAAVRRSKAALDAWCAAFVAPKIPGAPEITTATVRAMAADPSMVAAAARDAVERATADYSFFHWPLEFPAVFERGGFSVVLGNPPWERVKLQEKEFFAERSPVVAAATNAAARKKLIEQMEQTDPALWREYRAGLRRSDAESHVLRDSGRYPLCGRGDINTYAVFAELVRAVLAPDGRLGVILPTGIATDDTTKYFFGDVVRGRTLVSLHSFENEEFVFPAIHHALKFCLLTIAGGVVREPADLVFFARSIDQLDDPERHFSLTPDDFALLNPNTGTCPTFRSRTDAEMAKAIYRRVPVLIDESRGEVGNPWGVSFLRMFDMANDSGRFLDGPGPDRRPLYEAKMAHQFDHRYGTYEGQTEAQANQGTLNRPTLDEKRDARFQVAPKYWVRESDVAAAFGQRDRPWMLMWRDISRATDERTFIASVLPRVGAGHTALLMLSDDPLYGLLLAVANSFVFDWAARQKTSGTHLGYHVVRQLPVPTPADFRSSRVLGSAPLDEFLRPYVVELAVTSWDVIEFGRSLGWSGAPFIWDPDRRPRLRAEIDAAVAHAYGVDRKSLWHILDSFWVVADRDVKTHGTYRTRDLILEAYDAISDATPERPFLSRLDPPPGDPRAAHPPRPGEDPGTWRELSAPATTRPTRVARTGVTQATAAPTRTRAARPAPPAPELAQPLLPLAVDDDVWSPEATVNPIGITLGARVRHRAFGPGIILGVESAAKSTQLLIRFDRAGEKWIQFGFGLLEFQLE